MRSRRGWTVPMFAGAVVLGAVGAAQQCGPTSSTTTTTSSTTTTTSTTLAPPAGVTLCPPAWDDQVLADVNRERAAAGKPAVVIDAKLALGADNRATTMATNRAMNHDGWVQTITATGYSYSALAENIHAFATVQRVVGDWMASPGHKTNILNATYDDVGVGCALDERGVPWWALVLGQGQ